MSEQQTSYEALKEFYRAHAAIYDLTRWMLLAGRARAVLWLRLKPGERVVEIACGTGHNFSGIRERIGPGGEIIGVDLSAEMLAVARSRTEKNRWRNVRLVRRKAEELTLERPVDAALCSYCLTMIPDWRGALARLHGLLAPGGRVAVCDFRVSERWSPWLTRGYLRHMARHHVYPDRPIVGELEALYSRVHHRGGAGPWLYSCCAAAWK